VPRIAKLPRNSRPKDRWRISALALALAAALLPVAVGKASILDRNSSGLHAGNELIASCSRGMGFTYTTSFDPDIPGYAIDGIDVSHIPADCLRKSLSVTFYSEYDDAVGSVVDSTLPTSGTTLSIPVDPRSDTIAAGLVTGLSIVIS